MDGVSRRSTRSSRYQQASHSSGQHDSLRPMPTNLTYTENGQYAIHQGSEQRHERGSLYAQQEPSRAPSPYGAPTRSPSRYGTSEPETSYARYQYGNSYPDCLHYAEEIMHGGAPRPQGHVSSQERLTGRPLGNSDADNREIARLARRNNPYGASNANYRYADPEPGEAYGIIPSNNRSRRGVDNPYHFAPVVASDGGHRVTAEQDAGTLEDVSRRNTRPVMDMYRVDEPEQSFEHRYANPDAYGYTASTVVAQPYGPSTEELSRSKRRRHGDY